jgi:uncharacterized protein (TIGR02996 family)
MPRYEFQEGTSSKFWEINLLGKSFTTKFGKIGSNGQTKIKDCASEAAAKAEVDKLIAEKTKKGYQPAGGGSAKSVAKPKAPAGKTAPAPKSAGQYFELKDGSSSKFWEITLDGKAHAVRFGKIGADGQTSTKSFKSPGEARADHDKLVAEKTKKGYKLVRGEAPASPTTIHARNEKLEAAIAADPDNVDAYLVYADWLQSQSDPRGELVVLQHANKTAAAKKLLDQNKEHFFGKLANAQDILEAEKYASKLGRPTTWRWGYLESLRINNKHDRDAEFGEGELESIDVDEALGWMLDHPTCRFLRELTVGINTFMDNGYDGTAKVIGKRSLPLLKKLVIGAFISEETELNWSDAGNMEPLYKGVPNLEHLTLRSGTMKVGKIDLPKLKELAIYTGGLDKASLTNILSAKWPHLERLQLQTGDEGNIKLKDLLPIFDGKTFPKLKHLGLGNSPYSDELCAALIQSKLPAQLESLDFSEGKLGDQGATSLASIKWPKLKSIDVTENWLTKKAIASLKTIAKEVLDGGKYGQQDDEGDPENRYVSGNE